MDEVAAFAGVSAGSVLINGISIAIDPAADSLATIVQTIDEKAGGYLGKRAGLGA